MELIYGRNTVESYLNDKNNKAKKLWLLNTRTAQKYVDLAKRQNLPYELVTKGKLDTLVKGNHHAIRNS